MTIETTGTQPLSGHPVQDEEDLTQPPVSALRFATPAELYAAVPRIRTMLQHRPRENEEHTDFLARLAGSTTPEEAITFTAFAVVPKFTVWWAYECLRVTNDNLSAQDRELMELIAQWTTYPIAENRYRTMHKALYARVRSPQVFLGLAVGWSGGPIAPNDPAPVPVHRMPQAINSAVLLSLAQASLGNRNMHLAKFINQASALFRY